MIEGFRPLSSLSAFTKFHGGWDRLFYAEESVNIALRHKLTEKKYKEFIEKHKYSRLLYATRCKVSHELTSPGTPSEIEDIYSFEIPFAVPMDRFSDGLGRRTIVFEAWELCIPETFILDVLRTCVDAYLTECRQMRKAPYANNMGDRKMFGTYYDS